MLVGKIAGGKALAVSVRRDPEVLGHERGSPGYARLGAGHSLHVAMRHQPIADGLAERVAALWVHHPPDPPLQRVDQLLRFQFGAQRSTHRTERRPEDVARTGWFGFGVLLVDRVHRSVDVEIEPEVEEVLVDRGIEPIRVEELSVAWRLSHGHCAGGEDAS